MAKNDSQESWSLDEPGLSREDPLSVLIDASPYKSSQDKHGHEVFLGAKFPKGVGYWVEAILAKKSTPYEARSDVVRDAIYLGLRVLNSRYSMDPRWLTEEKLARITQFIKDELLFGEQEAQLVEDLESLCRNGYKDKAKESLKEYLEVLGPLSPERARILRRRLSSSEFDSLLREDAASDVTTPSN